MIRLKKIMYSVVFSFRLLVWALFSSEGSLNTQEGSLLDWVKQLIEWKSKVSNHEGGSLKRLILSNQLIKKFPDYFRDILIRTI